MKHAIQPVTFIGSFPAELPDTGLPEVAFAGRSNVGKSSALNCLLQQKKAARVSSRPGRTQTINLFTAGSYSLADLPGYGFAKVPPAVREQWKKMIDKYLTMRESLKLVIVFVDSRLPPQDLDADLIDMLDEYELPTLVVGTKVDKLTRNERPKQFRTLEDGFGLPADAILPFSSITGEGRDEIWEQIRVICAG